MKRIIRLLFLFAILMVMMSADNHHPVIYIIGDSTAAEKSDFQNNPERGWGMVLQGFFTEDVTVSNHAVNGRSSKSFINEGRWQKVLDELKPGDYVVIQFGHNDSKPSPDRHTDPGTTFDANLERYVNEARAKGATPILMSPVARRSFYNVVDTVTEDEALRNVAYGDEKINSDTLVDTHGKYRLSAANVARRLNVAYVDANAITTRIEQQYGIQGSRYLHMWLKPDECSAIPNGRKDNTHYNIYGARVVAGALADAIGEVVPELKPYVRHYDSVVSTQGRGNHLTLQDAIKALHPGRTYRILVIDGTWQTPKIPRGVKVEIDKYSSVEIQ